MTVDVFGQNFGKRMMKSKDKLMYCAIDVETSGLNPVKGDRVIECAAVKIEGDEIVDELSTLINVPCIIHPDAEKVHGITKSMLIDKREPVEVWPKFQKFVGKTEIVGHNIKFDLKFIRMELGLLGKRITNKINCTLQIARKIFPGLPDYRLETVANYVLGNIPQDYHLHRALYDARLVAKLWLAMERK